MGLKNAGEGKLPLITIENRRIWYFPVCLENHLWLCGVIRRLCWFSNLSFVLTA